MQMMLNLCCDSSSSEGYADSSDNDTIDDQFDYFQHLESTHNQVDKHLIEETTHKIIEKSFTQKIEKWFVVQHQLLVDHNMAQDDINQFYDNEKKSFFQENTQKICSSKDDHNKVLDQVICKQKPIDNNKSDNDLNDRRNGERAQHKRKSHVEKVRVASVPNHLNDLMSFIYNVDASLLDGKRKTKFDFISRESYQFSYKNIGSYINVMIPCLINSLWAKLQSIRQQKLEDAYKLMFFKSSERKNEPNVELKCKYICIKNNHDEFKFGEIVLLNFISQNEEQKTALGIIQHVETRLYEPQMHLELAPIGEDLMRQSCSDTNEWLLNQLSIMCADAVPDCHLVLVLGLCCVQNFLLQAKSIYDLANLSIGKQILEPVYDFGVSGISIDMTQRKSIQFFEDQLDAIQKSYEACFSHDSYSRFVCIHGPKESGKTEILRECILQLLKFGEANVKKILIVSHKMNEILSIMEQLKRHKIVAHVIVDTDCKELIDNNNKELVKKIEELNMMFADNLYADCIKYFKGEIDINQLSKEAFIESQKLKKNALQRLIIDAQVIIGSIDAICNNEAFNDVYYHKAFEIKNAFIDDAEYYSEPELISLTFAGVERMVLFGNINNDRIEDKLNEKEGNKSFICRYVRLSHTKKYCNNQSSIIKFDDSIANRHKLDKNKDYQRRENMRGDDDASNKFQYSKNSKFNKNHSRFEAKNCRMINSYKDVYTNTYGNHSKQRRQKNACFGRGNVPKNNIKNKNKSTCGNFPAAYNSNSESYLDPSMNQHSVYGANNVNMLMSPGFGTQVPLNINVNMPANAMNVPTTPAVAAYGNREAYLHHDLPNSSHQSFNYPAAFGRSYDAHNNQNSK